MSFRSRCGIFLYEPAILFSIILMTRFPRNLKLRDAHQACLLAFVVVVIWCWIHDRFSLAAWKVPLGYGGDGWLVMAFAKAFMDGDISPFLLKSVRYLGAPFVANWNDWPLTEELLFALTGWSARVIGLFPAMNLAVLFAHLLAGLSFWFVCRELKYRAAFAFSGAIVYAFSHYIFSRGLAHVVLSYYWHLPFVILVTWWTYSSEQIRPRDRKFVISALTAVISGSFNPYYSWIFAQFLGFAILLHLIRRQYKMIIFPAMLIGLLGTVFLAFNVDTILYSLREGGNSDAVVRSLSDLELYGLKLPELVFPPPYHPLRAWAEFGQSHYFQPTLIKGEMWSPYLGILGIIGFFGLVGVTIYRVLQGKAQAVPVHAWQMLWIFAFSLVGGVNLLMGSLALVYLVAKLLFWSSFQVGIAPLLIGIFFFGAVQLFFIGLLGEYIGSIHTKVRNMPLVIEAERINF